MTEKQFEKLIGAARREKPPRVDVAHKVLSALSIQILRQEAISEKQMIWVAVVSSAVAAMIAVAAVATYYNTDPITEVSQAISWVTQ